MSLYNAYFWLLIRFFQEILTRGLPYADHRNDAQVICAIIQGELPSCLQHWERWPNEYKALWSYICCPCWEALDIRPSIMNIANNLLNVISNDLKPPPAPPFPTTSRSQMPPLVRYFSDSLLFECDFLHRNAFLKPESKGISGQRSPTTSIASTKIGSELSTLKSRSSLSSTTKLYGTWRQDASFILLLILLKADFHCREKAILPTHFWQENLRTCFILIFNFQ